MKNTFIVTFGVVGSVLSAAVGGFDSTIVTLLLFMLIDYCSGMVVAGVFHASKKTESGTLESRAGWKGLCKKCMTLVFIIIGQRLDIEMGTTYIRDGVCIAFISNELLSIIENAGLMGVPIPQIIVNAIDVLKGKEGEPNEQIG